MNKICLTLLITVLITLPFGCSPSKKEFASLKSNLDNKVQKLNADIQRNDRQIKNETSAIKNDIEGMKSSLNGEVQKLNTDIQKNDSQLENRISGLSDIVQKLDADIKKNSSQIEKETSTIKKDLDGLKFSLNGEVQKLNTGIQKNNSQFENEIQAIKKDSDDLKSSLSDQVQKLNTGIQKNNSQFENEIPVIKKDLDGLKFSLNSQAQELNAGIQETVNRQKIYWIIAILVLFFIVAGVFFFLKYRIVSLNSMLSSKFNSSIEDLKNETIQLDTKLVQVLERQLENGNLQLRQEAEPDHSLPIKVCEEIQRMRNRMKHMDQDDQVTKVFRKRLESLEEKLNDMEYEIVKLEDKPYNEGMTVKASFISNEDMKDGEEIITRVIKPQINYKNVLIQAAEVEVSQGV